MTKLFYGRLKYLFLIPVALMIGFSYFYTYVINAIDQQTLGEKMVEKRLEIELISSIIENYVERDQDWSRYDYPGDINVMIEKLDEMDAVFAAQYDGQLQLLSRRIVDHDHEPFNPMLFPGFADIVRQNERGELEYPYDNGKWTSPMQLYYQWLPSDTSYENRSLLIIGATQDSIVTKQEVWLTVGIVVQIAITFIANVAFVVLLCYVGCGSQSGRKRRALQ